MPRRPVIVLALSLFVVSGFATAGAQAWPRGAARDRASDGATGSRRVPIPPQTNPAWLEGVDVSHYNGSIDWSQVASSGERFVIMKATEGTGYVDPTYSSNRQGAIAAGLVVTAYHFARPDLHPATAGAAAEADHYVDVAGIGAGDIIPALDLERDGGLSPSKLIAWAEAWLQEVKARTGFTPMIYTGPARWEEKMGDTSQLADEGYRLWLAHWCSPPSGSCPRVPGSDWDGHGWTFWQYTDCGNVPGIGGCVDLDHYRSTNFAPVRIPTLRVTTNGIGTVTSAPAGIDCGSTCTAAVDPGSAYTLTAAPNPGAVLVSWARACTGAAGCTVKMLGNKRVDAVFGYTLSLSVSGPAGGTVTSSPAGIDCGTTGGPCSANFGAGTSVTLSATPDAGSQFQGWGGDCTGQDLTCTTVLDAARSVSATFADDTPPTATITTPATIADGAVATFDEPVHDVTPDDLVVRAQGSSFGLAATVACSDATGAATDCVTGDVQTATVTPDDELTPGQDYEVVVNPDVASTQIVDSSGNPAAETTTPFRAATTVDDPDLRSGWHWRVVSNKRAVGGAYTKDDLAGAFAVASFSGGSVRWNTATGPDEGRARVLIDGTSRGVFDLSARTTSFVHRRFGGLGLGTHVIRVVVLGRHGVHGTGTNVAVDGFVAGGAAVPTTDVTYGWSTRRAAGASGGSVAVDDERGASLVLRFRGTSIRWLTARGPGEGRAEVFLDGHEVATFDGYASQTAYGAARSFGGLTDEVHTLRIFVLGTARSASSGTAVVVDGFEIG